MIPPSGANHHTARRAPEDIILATAHSIAVVGLTDRPQRADYRVARYLQAHGYRIVPINPTVPGPILGETVYPHLRAVPEPVDLVDIFRRPSRTDRHINEAIAIGAKAVWLQLGIRNDVGIARARAAGLLAVQDRCTMAEHLRRSARWERRS